MDSMNRVRIVSVVVENLLRNCFVFILYLSVPRQFSDCMVNRGDETSSVRFLQ